MPLGISEGALKAAYGPQDFSGIYKGIQNSFNKLYAEEKMYRQQNMREYMQASNKLSDASKGIRFKDTADVMKNTNDWKMYKKLQDADPMMMQNNPDKWAELQGKIDESYSTAMGLANDSKQFATEHKNFGLKIATNPHVYKDDAQKMWDAANNMSLGEIRERGLDNYSAYVSETPEYQKLLDKFEKKAVPVKEKLGDIEYSGTGTGKQQKQLKYKDVADFNSYIGAAVDSINEFGKTPNGKLRYAKAILDNSDYDSEVKKFEQNLKSTPVEKLKLMGITNESLQSAGIIGNKHSDSDVVKASKLMAIRKFNDDFGKVSVEDPGFKFADQKRAMEFSSDLSYRKSKQLIKDRQKQLDSFQASQFDISKRFDNITKEDSPSSYKASENLVNDINNSGKLVGVSAAFVSSSPSRWDIPAFRNSENILNNLGNVTKQSGKDKISATQANEEGVAKKMEEDNIKNGILNVKINPKALVAGRVMALSWTDQASGDVKNVYLDLTDSDSKRKYNSIIKSHIESRKDLLQEGSYMETPTDSGIRWDQ
jgi:hypothetical protein